MKKLILTALAIAMSNFWGYSQELNQTIRGSIKDIDNNSPLIGVSVILLGTDPIVGVVTDLNGNFRIEKVPTGRVNLQVSYIGYTSKTISNLIVDSGKEVVLDLKLQESTVKLKELVVRANNEKGAPINDMAFNSARSIAPDDTKRFPGSFNDPSRIVASFAGVTATQDGSNDIIVRGNAPKYMHWRLEGVQITNPNHFGDQNANGGGVSTLNNNMLAASDFYTGAFAPEYGNGLSAVYDVKLRAGNNEKRESVVGLGLLGTDLTLEGPFKQGYGGSYVANYRYSTISLINDLGLVDVGGIPVFQDASFKVLLPTKNLGTFSAFGLGGMSGFVFEDITPEVWETPGNRSFASTIYEDYEKKTYLLNTGINHTINISKNSYLSTTLSYSSEGINDDIYEYGLVEINDDQGAFLRDSVINRTKNFDTDLIKSTYRAAVNYHHKFSAKSKIQGGVIYSLSGYDYEQNQVVDSTLENYTVVDFNEHIGTIQTFVSWRYRLNEDITFVSGLHNTNVLLNNKFTIEPRIAVNWQLNPLNAIHAGFGKHSVMESIHHYFTRLPQSDGSVIQPNEDLDLLKSNHYVLGYENKLAPNMRLNLEVYYQYLYDLPVENDESSYYSTINEGLEFTYLDLVNKGTGRNYGIELTLEKFYHNNYYFMINTSVFQSKYTALDKIERNTQYNSNYMVNLLLGKEFINLGRKDNQTLAINAKAFWGGARKIIPLLRDENGALAVDPDNGLFWDYERAYEDGLDNTFNLTVSASYKWNKPKATHEIFLDLNNLTNNLGRISEYYDENEPGSVGYLTQFEFFPNLMYRVYF